MPARFEAVAERMPQAEAVVCGPNSIRYGDLNRQANQLARHLRSLGAGPETLVAVCLERSLELVTALLGVLKAGAAYVPLDPEYPRERLAFMLADSGAGIVLTHSRLRPLLPETPGCLLLELDQLQQPLAALPDTNLNLPILPLSLAYMIYTSGSTGTPKGVAQHPRSRRQLGGLAPERIRRYGAGPGFSGSQSRIRRIRVGDLALRNLWCQLVYGIHTTGMVCP